MKILVTVKRVEDPEIKIKLKPDGSGIEAADMKYVVNPFDEIAVEEALRLRDQAGGEVVVACLGPQEANAQLRTTLAMGADRGVHVVVAGACDPSMAARTLAKVIGDEKPDLVLLGKQAIDDDAGQVGARVAEHLGWGQVTFASKEASLESAAEKEKKPAFSLQQGKLEVVREVDGGIETLRVQLPAVVTTELRLNTPRYASLPGIMKAKKKEIKELSLAGLALDDRIEVKVLQMAAPAGRQGGAKVADVAALLDKLRHEAKVL